MRGCFMAALEMPAARETIRIIRPQIPTIESDPRTAIGTSTSSLWIPMPARPITEPKSMLKHRNVITAIAQTDPVILTGLTGSAPSNAVNPDPHCLQNLVPSADSAPHAGMKGEVLYPRCISGRLQFGSVKSCGSQNERDRLDLMAVPKLFICSLRRFRR